MKYYGICGRGGKIEEAMKKYQVRKWDGQSIIENL